MSNKWITYENSGLPQEKQIQVSVHRTARVNIVKPLAAWRAYGTLRNETKWYFAKRSNEQKRVRGKYDQNHISPTK